MFVERSGDGYSEVAPGVRLRVLAHGDSTLMGEFRLSAGHVLPAHTHPHEQTGYLVSGRIVLRVGDEARDLRPGDSWCIPGGVEHSADLIEDSVAVEVWSPVRRDLLPVGAAAAQPTLRSPQTTLYTRNLPRALAFYEALGFREVFRYAPAGEPEHVELLLDGFNLGIATVETAVANHGLDPVPGGRGMEIVLWADDVDAAATRAQSLGAAVLSPPHDWLGGRLRLCWVADPDGNPIQLAQRLG